MSEHVQAIHSRLGKDNMHPEGFEVVRWPEFIAFAKRLGIDLTLPFRGIVISIPFEGECVEITQTYIADDINQPNAKTPFDDRLRPLDVTTCQSPGVTRSFASKAARNYVPEMPPGPPNPPKGDKPREVG